MSKRKTKITRNYLMHPFGSVLIETGKTKVLCTASVEAGVPPFLKSADPPQGWLTAEYNMIPGAPNNRFRRERSKVSGRTAEIQRLIGRSLRAVVDRELFPGYTIYLDCDVLQADGGTRTASITGACVALYDAFIKMIDQQMIVKNPLKEWVAAISVGVSDGEIVVDLDYGQDSTADVDMNIVMTESGEFIEIQGTAEAEPFDDIQLRKMINKSKSAIKQLVKAQRAAIGK